MSFPKSLKVSAFLALAAFLVTQGMAAGPSAPTYSITKTVPLGAPDHWDYVVFDPVLNWVYVSHSEKVTVVDATSGAMIGQIDGITGSTHGIVSVHALGKGYTDDGKAGIAVTFDLKNSQDTEADQS